MPDVVRVPAAGRHEPSGGYEPLEMRDGHGQWVKQDVPIAEATRQLSRPENGPPGTRAFPALRGVRLAVPQTRFGPDTQRKERLL